ncbi:TPA_asm: hypothetical protein G0D46_24145 [Salmonella enterica subsp. enterica serovar Java]|nr:hypothetical protein [Salmonella enterica subsp. enterica serovar Java]
MALLLIRATKFHILTEDPMQATIDHVPYTPVCNIVALIGIAITTLMALRLNQLQGTQGYE